MLQRSQEIQISIRLRQMQSEVAKTYLNSGKEPYMYYYKDKDAKEIDIVLVSDGILNPMGKSLILHHVNL